LKRRLNIEAKRCDASNRKPKHDRDLMFSVEEVFFSSREGRKEDGINETENSENSSPARREGRRERSRRGIMKIKRREETNLFGARSPSTLSRSSRISLFEGDSGYWILEPSFHDADSMLSKHEDGKQRILRTSENKKGNLPFYPRST